MVATEPHAVHAVHQDGAGPRVIVVHGAMDRSVSFGRVARHLSERDVVRYDRRGYARSRPLGPAGLEVHVADLEGLADGQPVVLVGHSVGGVVALAAAAHGRVPVLGVLAYEAPTPWEPWWPRPATEAVGEATLPEGADAADEAEAFMRRMIGDRLWARLPRSTRAERRAEGEALRADLAMVEVAGAPYDLAAVTVPVWAVAGSETTWWHRRAADELAAAAPAGDLALIDGAGHGAHLTHPEAFSDLIRSFVDHVA